MPNLEERLQAVVALAEVDGDKWHNIVHGSDSTVVPTENGDVPSVAKQLKDVRAEIIHGLEDYVGDCRQAKAGPVRLFRCSSNARWAVDPFVRNRKSFWQRKRPTVRLWV